MLNTTTDVRANMRDYLYNVAIKGIDDDMFFVVCFTLTPETLGNNLEVTKAFFGDNFTTQVFFDTIKKMKEEYKDVAKYYLVSNVSNNVGNLFDDERIDSGNVNICF